MAPLISSYSICVYIQYYGIHGKLNNYPCHSKPVALCRGCARTATEMADSTSADSYRKPNSIEQREDYRRQPPSRSRSRSRSRSPPPRSSNNGSGRRRPSPRPRRRQSPEYTSRRREEQEDDRRYRDQQRSRNRDRDRDRDSYSYNRDRRDSRRDRDRSFRDGPPASSSSKPPVQEKESGPGGPSQGSIKQLKAPMAAVSMIEVEANDRLGGKGAPVFSQSLGIDLAKV